MPSAHEWSRWLGWLALCLLLAGCTHAVVREHHTALALEEARQTWLGEQVAQVLATQNEPDGFGMLANGKEAFGVRAGLIQQAQRELDIQTYLLGEGQTTNLVLARLLKAAEGGVRVRLLVDDIGAVGQGERLAALASHPYIHVRVYNPVAFGRSNLVTRVLASITNPAQQHRRMHNKLWIADNSVAIVGGRNLGDEYFDANDARNFADLDLVAVGEVVPELSRSFDLYWNHGLAQPIERYHQVAASAWQGLQGELDEWLEDNADSAYFSELRQQSREAPPWETLHWGKGRALWDAPGKLAESGAPDWQTTLLGDLTANMQVQEQLTLISAYFVPTKDGVERLTRLADQGVEVEVITNSLESTDAAVVHGAYAPWRQTLLAHGVTLFELRPEQEAGEVDADAENEMRVPGASASALHIKAIRGDDQLFVGSFNVDPRSVLWNSEVGVLVESATLMDAFDELMEIGRDPAISYHVIHDEEGRLTWELEHDGEPRWLTEEPGSLWRHFNAWVSQAFRLERWL
ncbi:phospholipase D family protein [Halomonas aquamarina]|uniref:Phospholipase D family protein n=1 Tax=Vreelandella aquamarina TaxID=77097 RepID=A0ACC5VXT9_9GAMM|nr:phospholipase D family protein [Halomonas aquamarina]MBZ5488601.1 phospholipase D family protein [Halomonas aquamarina]